jgi:O-methyltransferase involved in polyketide biosynthesis
MEDIRLEIRDTGKSLVLYIPVEAIRDLIKLIDENSDDGELGLELWQMNDKSAKEKDWSWLVYQKVMVDSHEILTQKQYNEWKESKDE